MALPVLSSELSRAQLRKHYLDYIDYDLVESAERARVFVQAGRMLLAMPITRTASGGRGGEELELEPLIVERQVTAAKAWLSAHQANATDSQVELGIDPDWRDL